MLTECLKELRQKAKKQYDAVMLKLDAACDGKPLARLPTRDSVVVRKRRERGLKSLRACLAQKGMTENGTTEVSYEYLSM